MVNGNGSKDDLEAKVKWCAFLKAYCIKERCAQNIEMVRQIAGVAQKSRMCIFDVFGVILSEINAKTQPPQQKINLPKGLFRG